MEPVELRGIQRNQVVPAGGTGGTGGRRDARAASGTLVGGSTGSTAQFHQNWQNRLPYPRYHRFHRKNDWGNQQRQIANHDEEFLRLGAGPIVKYLFVENVEASRHNLAAAYAAASRGRLHKYPQGCACLLRPRWVHRRPPSSETLGPMQRPHNRTARAALSPPGARRCLPRHECDTDRSEEKSLVRNRRRLVDRCLRPSVHSGKPWHQRSW